MRFSLTQSYCEDASFEETPQIRTRAFLRNSTGSQDFSKNSENTPNKINYKYQRVNNTFKLVEVNSTEENKENCPKNQKDPSEKKTLMMIHSLCERVERL